MHFEIPTGLSLGWACEHRVTCCSLGARCAVFGGSKRVVAKLAPRSVSWTARGCRVHKWEPPPCPLRRWQQGGGSRSPGTWGGAAAAVCCRVRQSRL
eukprot:scaffold106_cov380-Prasinococcus_capsulatus_cf.AAC.59